MIITISDESGDIGAEGSSLYLSYINCLVTDDSINSLVEISREISRKYLTTPLRKWSQLKGSVKKDPDKLLGFSEELIKRLHDKQHHIISSLSIIDKSRFKNSYISTKQDLLNIEQIRAYKYAFSRIGPFIKKLHFSLKRYPELPKIKWIIDENHGDFKKRLIVEAVPVITNNKIELDGPYFIGKNEDPRLSKAILITDLFAGFCKISFENHTECLLKNGGVCPCSECANPEQCTKGCKNPYRKLWDFVINNTVRDVSILLNGQKIWDWHSLFYSPILSRKIHKNFLKEDPFIII